MRVKIDKQCVISTPSIPKEIVPQLQAIAAANDWKMSQLVRQAIVTLRDYPGEVGPDKAPAYGTMQKISNVYLDPVTFAWFRQTALAKGMNFGELVRNAVTFYLQLQAPKKEETPQ